MDNLGNNHNKQNDSCLIYFDNRVCGKPTNNRKEDPDMFQLLRWGTQGLQKHSFKKDQKFHSTPNVYLNMIGKTSWISQSQQNFINFNDGCVQADPYVIKTIDNYIRDRVPQQQNNIKKSPKKKLNYQQQTKFADKQQQFKENIKKDYINRRDQQNKEHFGELGCLKQKRRNSVCSNFKSNNKRIIQQHQLNPSNSNKHRQKKLIPQKMYSDSSQKQKQPDLQLTQSEQAKIIQNFKQTTRWIPNSAFTTYFGKPPFQNYGSGNTKPTHGGLLYGSYLYSHNVHPHRGKNQPKNIQSYPIALMKAKSHGTLVPTHPKTKLLVYPKQFQESLENREHSNKIQPESNCFVGSLNIQVPKLAQMQKFGGKKNQKKRADLQNA